jgi:hypothetical protein
MKSKLFTLLFLLSFLYNSSFAQDLIDNRPTLSSVELTEIVTPKNDPLLFYIIPDKKVIEQKSDDDEDDKRALEKTKERLLKEANDRSVFPVNTTNQPILSAINPLLGRNFKGNPSGATPSDCGFAISNSGFMVGSVNGSVIMYDESGKALLTSTLSNFLQIGTTFSFDPRVLYDSKYDRFIFCGMTKTSVILLYSTSDDPTKPWKKYTLSIANMGGSSSDGLDYPHIGLTDTELHLGVTLTGGNKFPLLQINNRSGYDGTKLIYNTWIGQTSQPTNCVIPVNKGQQDSPYGNTAYFLQPSRQGSSNLYLFKISDTLGATPAPTLTRTSLTIPAYSPAGYVSQKGGSTMRTSDCRPMSSVYVDGIIHLVFHEDYKKSGYYGIRYCRIDVKNGNDIKTATIQDSDNKINYCFPSVASFATSPSDKTALVTFMVSGTSIYPGIKTAVIDDQMNWSAPLTIKDGTNSISGGRWGDYSCSSRKHNSNIPTVWVEAQYGASGKNYEMWIGEITKSGPNTISSIEEQKTTTQLYPNPVIDLFYLKFTCDKLQDIIINLVDMQGKVVQNLFKGNVNRGTNTLTFNKNAISAGIYIVQVLSSSNTIISKEKLIVGSN